VRLERPLNALHAWLKWRHSSREEKEAYHQVAAMVNERDEFEQASLMTGESVLSFDGSRVIEQRIGKPRRHGLLAMHFVFKLTAFVLYMIGPRWFTLDYASTFVFVVLALSLDFWLVKNLSGRLLAGLRWWNIVREDDDAMDQVKKPKMEWHFEAWTAEDQEVARNAQVNLFWTGLVGQQLIWILLLLATVFSLQLGWFVITVIANGLNCANLYGYIRCRLQRKDSVVKQASLLARLGETIGALFKPEGYMRGQRTSTGTYDFSSGATP